MHRLTAVAGALVAALALMLWGTSPAFAGGATSVLVVSPESRETASLHYSDKEYAQLEGLLGPLGRGTRERPPETVMGTARLINVTWMVHDTTPWRVDRVFLGEMDQEVWIQTSGRFDETTEGLWHRALSPTDLHKFFYELGVKGKASGTVAGTGFHPAPWEEERAAAETDRKAATDQEAAGAATGTRAAGAPGDGTDWWWAIPGLVAGAALGLVLRPYVTGRGRPGRRKDDPGPRQEVLDV